MAENTLRGRALSATDAGTSPRARRAATVALEHVSKRFGDRADGQLAVDDLDLFVPAGATCVLVGPSGCGKTTTLRMVNRLIEPSGGRILIDGAPIAGRDPTELRRGIGYVIQQVGLFPHQTIAENVEVVPRLLGWPAARRRERVEELLRLVGLDPARHLRRYPAELSGGERQRVGVARALAADPPLLLMDEPFGAVDPIVRARLQEELLRLQRELGKTILFVTHDIDEAIRMGDLVAVMRQGGTLAQFAPPAELLARPASDFVARFVGTDRALKRLTLRRVGELTPASVPLAVAGEPVGAGRARAGSGAPGRLLLVDREGHAVGWLDARGLPDDRPADVAAAQPPTPLLQPETTLRDALSLLLDAEGSPGIVVDGAGRPMGLVTVEAITAALQDVDGDAGPDTRQAPPGGPSDPSARRDAPGAMDGDRGRPAAGTPLPGG